MHQASVDGWVDNVIPWINLDQVDSAVRFVNTYPLDNNSFVS